jgi:predicted alpha/beta hydrolase family esterase
MSQKHVYIIHGYSASPEAHWFPWLKQKLIDTGVQVSVLAMPTPTSPDHIAWLEHLNEHIQSPNENTFFVAHSLGCITLLHYLNSLSKQIKIGGVILVSGFISPLSILPALDPFTKDDFNPAHIMSLSENRVVIASRDDSIVPYVQTKELSQLLNMPLLEIEKGGHFLASDGFTKFPIVYEILQKMLC